MAKIQNEFKNFFRNSNQLEVSMSKFQNQWALLTILENSNIHTVYCNINDFDQGKVLYIPF
jgi:hypothetical protein